ncbi:MAG: cyclic beta 1-2 glucan synthetase, partial [Rhodanobacteraceae bacterium]
MRAELFSGEQMELHGRALAERHQPVFGKASDQLIGRLTQNRAVLLDVCTRLSEAIKAGRSITPAADWLLDNFYLVEEQIRTAKRHFPKAYSWQLPRLQSGPSAQLPRVYDIALQAIAHGDGRVDQDSLSRFVAAYQEVTGLTLGELWAIPIMLRLALIENLRRVALLVIENLTQRNLAENWAEQMVATSNSDPKGLILVVADMARSEPPMVSSFVAEIVRHLRAHGMALALPLTWIQQRLAESGLTIEQLVQTENRQQAALQVSVSNSIGSLRQLEIIDWREFVEEVSQVEQALHADPAGAYAQMDFATRDHYRHVIERVAKNNSRSELDVARAAVDLARRGAIDSGSESRRAHVGYYLIDNGLIDLQRSVGRRVALEEWPRQVPGSFPVSLYLGSIAGTAIVLTALLLAHAEADGATGWMLVLLGALAFFVASQFGVAVVNRLSALTAAPRILPRMDFERGIPPECKTLVAVPCMLSDDETVDRLVEDLEIRFLANRDPHLSYALLTDFPDAPAAMMPSDDALLVRAATAIERLNAEYADPGRAPFFLLHRPRRWNECEGVWMGRERKRGKLADLNALLRGDPGDRFSLITGDTSILSGVKYVITLDADTQLPRESARTMVAALAHPLNRAEYDAKRRRVTLGYGILQPRVGARAMDSRDAESRGSHYLALFGGEWGIDPYTRAVSDTYQDLFGEGSFIGKGIYDLDTFERALNDRFPDNRILSHDLLEGCYARSGLLSDVELRESFPWRYVDDVRRRHRWIRGDWQLAGWLFPWVAGPHGALEKNTLTALSRWKILDNLRRSLVPLALLGVLLTGWIVLASPWFWTATVLGALLLPALLDCMLDLARVADDQTFGAHVATQLRSAARRVAQIAFALICLPFETWFGLDAIVRTLWRMHISQRHLLEWMPSGSFDSASEAGFAASWRLMWIAPVLSLAAAVALTVLRPWALPVVAPILLLWFFSPAVAWWTSRPHADRHLLLEPFEALFLRRMARRTWSFFEHYVGAEDHWLPPDNVQEQPQATVAHRTSPTNIGLALLANLAAWDFGYLTAAGLVERTGHTLGTLRELERYRGHFFNWYDTATLQPLLPMYISTVDSGNLVGHLLTLRQGLLALRDAPVLHPRVLDGLADTLALCAEGAAERGAEVRAQLLAHLAHARESPVV